MKGKTLTYWIATILLAALMAFDAFALLTRQPMMAEAIASLGYPPYFPILLGIAKAAGVVALLIGGVPRLKEWAYAGFTITFVSAFFSHLESGQDKQAAMPVLALILLSVSYLLRPPTRRLIDAPPHNP